MSIVRPTDLKDLNEALAWALDSRTGLQVMGRGSKSDLGRAEDYDATLDLSAFAGVSMYEPGELVIKAGAATPLEEIKALLHENNQCLAFEPPDWNGLFEQEPATQSLGGVLSTNLSGSRRLTAGAARDHLLGFTGMNGRAEEIRSGGRVMKNVTGYDLSKLVCGAYGTLAVLTEATLKVRPQAQDTRTLAVFGLSDEDGIHLLRDVMSSPYEPSAAAHLPRSVTVRSHLPEITHAAAAATLVRLEGDGASLEKRLDHVRRLIADNGFADGALAGHRGVVQLGGRASQQLWREVGDVAYFSERPGVVWRISTAPSHGTAVVSMMGADAWFYDWAGGLIWALFDDVRTGDAELIRSAISELGGHATLVRGPKELRNSVGAFQPLAPGVYEINRRIKKAFDPMGVLNPRRMYSDF